MGKNEEGGRRSFEILPQLLHSFLNHKLQWRRIIEATFLTLPSLAHPSNRMGIGPLPRDAAHMARDSPMTTTKTITTLQNERHGENLQGAGIVAEV